MKTYRELYFRGDESQLKEFVNYFKEYERGEWKTEKTLERWKDYLFIDYLGDKVENARVSIFLGDRISSGELKVGNIVPLTKSQLSIDEYNDVLIQFYNDLVIPFKNTHSEIIILQPSDDNFDPTTVISKKALEKLRLFCNAANKSTGSSHPCDQERWFDFICQTVDDGKMFDSSTLENFLKDKTFWGEKKEENMGAMGEYAWDDEKAYELSLEYEQACDILCYYKKNRGI